MSGPEDMSHFVRNESPHGMTLEELVEWAAFINGPEPTLTGTFDDTPPSPQERIRAHYRRWARAHRN